LAKVGERLRLRESLLGAQGSLSPTKVSGETPEGLGAVVTGVNDAPEGAVFSESDDIDATTGAILKAPLSPAELAAQQARAARYADPSGAGARVAGLDDAPPPARPRIFDASEGTPLDPLLNKTYDLNYGKTVPSLN
jgi:UPF0755 protein